MVVDDLENVTPTVDRELRKFSLSQYFTKQTSSVPSDLVLKFQDASKKPNADEILRSLSVDFAEHKKGRKKKEKEECLSTMDAVSYLEELIDFSFRYQEDSIVPKDVGCNFVNFEFTLNCPHADTLFGNVMDLGFLFRQPVLTPFL